MKILTSYSVFALALLLALLDIPLAASETWTSSGLGGGGTQTTIAIQPGVSPSGYSEGHYPVILEGADVNGLNRSTDYGKSWAGANVGTNPAGVPYVASVMWDPEYTDVAYAATGYGLYESTDEGANWFCINLGTDTTDGTPLFVFDSNGTNASGQPSQFQLPRYPRPAGNLLAIGGSGTRYLYVGATNINGSYTTNAGRVFRATDAGNANWVADGWTEITPTSDGASYFVDSPVTGITVDPDSANNLFVATFGNGVWYTTDAETATTDASYWAPITANIAFPQALLLLPTPTGANTETLYVAGSESDPGVDPLGSCNPSDGYGGVWSANGPLYTDFLPVPGTELSGTDSPLSSATSWSAITGSYSDGTTVLFVGAAYPQTDGFKDNYYTPIVDGVTTNGTSWTWQSAAVATDEGATIANISTNTYDNNGQQWWLSYPAGNQKYLLGGFWNGIGEFALDPNYPQGTNTQLFIASREDIWSAPVTYSGSSVQVGTWHPDVGGYTDSGVIGGGLGVKDARGLAVDPNHAGHLYAGTPDLTFFYSTDYGASFFRNAPSHESTDGSVSPIQTGDECKTICVDPLNSYVAMTTASESNFEGNVWFWPSSDLGSTDVGWVDTGLGAATYASDGFNATPSGGCSGSTYESLEVQGMVLGRATDGTWTTGVPLVCIAVTGGASDGNPGGIWYGTSSDNGSADTWTWTQVNTKMKPVSGAAVPMVWHQNNKWVYAYEQTTGLWRSSDGQNWSEFSQIWTPATGSTENWGWGLSSIKADTGYLVQDSNTNGAAILFLSALGTDTAGSNAPSPGVYVIQQADTGASATDGPSFSQLLVATDGLVPGPLAFANGDLYCVCAVNGYVNGSLTPAPQGEVLECTNPFETDGPAHADWVQVSNSTYSGQMNWAFSTAVDTDNNGTIYVGSPEGIELGTDN